MPPDGMELTIIVPVLNEIETLPALLEHLLHWQNRGARVLIVDGGSVDQTAETARYRGFTVIEAPPGRASQMNAGAQASQSDYLLFLHADTFLPEQADHLVLENLRCPDAGWGRFDVRINGTSRLLPIIAWFMNTRSRLTGIATGDQALFMTRNAFNRAGGFPGQPLMEDIEMSRRLKQITRPVCLHEKAITSGRRWDSQGSWRTILLMWQLRWAYWRGVSAEQLSERYR